jgi:hypothetical protein
MVRWRDGKQRDKEKKRKRGEERILTKRKREG